MKAFINDALWFLNTNGVNPYYRNNIRISFSLLIFFSVTAGLVLDALFNWKGRYSIEGLTDLVGTWQANFKFLILLINNKKFAKILGILEEFWPTDIHGQAFQVKIDAANSSMSKFLKTMKASYIVLVISYIGKPILTRSRTLLAPCYYFSLDLNASPAFELIYVQQLLNGILAVCVMSGFDMLFVSLIFYVVVELKLIKKYISKIPIDPLHLKDATASFHFKQVIKHHSKVLGFIDEMNSCYSAFLLNQLLTSTFCVCGSLLVLSSESSKQTRTYLVYLITFLGQIFFYCFAGSCIVTESLSVSNSLYEMAWWIKTQPQLRRGISLAIMRSQKEAKLTAGGMFNLDLNCFTNIIQTGLSFFTLVRTIYSKEGNKI